MPAEDDAGERSFGRDYVGTLGADLFRLVPFRSVKAGVDGSVKCPKCAVSGSPGA